MRHLETDTATEEPSTKGERTRQYQEKVEAYLKGLGAWHFNLINGANIFRETGSDKWQSCDTRLYNSIVRDLSLNHNWRVNAQTIKNSVESDFSEGINPLVDYFETLDQKAFEGRLKTEGRQIEAYADCLTTHLGKRFVHFFRKWLVASVANVFEEYHCTNHLCLTLIGNQGDGKSKYLNGLVPETLAEFCYSGKINFNNDQDIMIKLSSNFLLHIEETLPDLMEKHENEVKEFITRDRCNYIRKYENVQRLWARTANVCASLNGTEFLTDATGDRRFLVLKVLEVNRKRMAEIDIDALWLEALVLYRNKAIYWLTEDENAEIQRNNQAFRVVSEEAETLAKLFDLHLGVEDPRSVASHRYTATDLAHMMREQLRLHKISKKSVGTALRRLGLESKQDTDGGRYYYFTPIDGDGNVGDQYNPHQAPELKAEREKREKQARAERMRQATEAEQYNQAKYGPNNSFDS